MTGPAHNDHQPKPRPLSGKQKLGLAAAALALVAWYAQSEHTPTVSQRLNSIAVGYTPATPESARAACQRFLRQLAHDPDSMEWVNPSTWQAYPEPEQAGRWFVRGYARGRTPAGGKLLGPVGCTLTYYGADSRWELLDVSQDR